MSDVPELVWSPYGGGQLAQHPCLQAHKYKGTILRFNADIRDKVIDWVESPPGMHTDERHFAARVIGRSMEPLIPDGSLCLFRLDVAGSRAGKVLLVQHHAISDPESGGSFTVKKYRSWKVQTDDAADDPGWTHAAIRLEPLNDEFNTIWLNPDQADDLRVIAEFVRVLP